MNEPSEPTPQPPADAGDLPACHGAGGIAIRHAAMEAPAGNGERLSRSADGVDQQG